MGTGKSENLAHVKILEPPKVEEPLWRPLPKEFFIDDGGTLMRRLPNHNNDACCINIHEPENYFYAVSQVTGDIYCIAGHRILRPVNSVNMEVVPK